MRHDNIIICVYATINVVRVYHINNRLPCTRIYVYFSDQHTSVSFNGNPTVVEGTSENCAHQRCETSREIAIVRNPPTASVAIKTRHDASLKDSQRSSASEYLNTFYLIDSELERVVHCGAHDP